MGFGGERKISFIHFLYTFPLFLLSLVAAACQYVLIFVYFVYVETRSLYITLHKSPEPAQRILKNDSLFIEHEQ